MAILAKLRNSFTHIQAWQPGYQIMLDYHQQGICHAPEDAKKQNQEPPISTGCEYADTVLLPLLHQSQRFLDQEVVTTLATSDK